MCNYFMILINKSGDRVYLSNYRRMSFTRKGLKIADGFAEVVNWRRKDNTMAKGTDPQNTTENTKDWIIRTAEKRCELSKHIMLH
jgi:hypothetical protein